MIDDTIAWLCTRIENDPIYNLMGAYAARRAYATSITMPIYKAQIEQIGGVCLVSDKGWYFTKAQKAHEVETENDLKQLEGLDNPELTFLVTGMKFKQLFGQNWMNSIPMTITNV